MHTAHLQSMVSIVAADCITFPTSRLLENEYTITLMEADIRTLVGKVCNKGLSDAVLKCVPLLIEKDLLPTRCHLEKYEEVEDNTCHSTCPDTLQMYWYNGVQVAGGGVIAIGQVEYSFDGDRYELDEWLTKIGEHMHTTR